SPTSGVKGGSWAGAGESSDNRYGGGAYVGIDGDGAATGTNAGGTGAAYASGSSSVPGTTISSEPANQTAGSKGGDASLTATDDLTGYIIIVEGGNGGNTNGSGAGGSATLNVASDTVTTDSLTVQSGANGTGGGNAAGGKATAIIRILRGTDDGDADYTFTKTTGGGDLEVVITTLEARWGHVELTVEGAAEGNVRITNLDLGGDKKFTLNEVSTSDLGINFFNVWGPATFEGDLDASGKTMRFYLPSDMEAVDIRMLTMAEDSSVNIAGSRIDAAVISLDGSTVLKEGDRIILIDATQTMDGLGVGPANKTTIGQGMVGSLLRNEITLATEESIEGGITDLLVAILGAFSAGSESDIVLIGDQGRGALVVQGGDLIAAAISAGMKEDEEPGLELFGIVSGGKLRYDSSPRLDLTSAHLLTGVSRSWNLTQSRMTVGGFFEYAAGSYESRGLYESGEISSHGNVRYVGGGVLARADFAETDRGRLYAEASARAGSAHADFNSRELRDYTGTRAHYKSDSPYFGLHAGFGYLWDLSETSSFDIFGKYFWTRVTGDTLRVSTGEQLVLQDFNSRRMRLGGRYSRATGESVSYYASAAWEHEFDGRSRGTVNGYSLGGSSLSGSSAVGELGVLITPSETQPLYVDLGIQAYAGAKEGVTGRLEINWEF
ncbi:MAG: autotransporter outer membrane beta-barrel domain-containing protein, partial [Synergistaceae bacterium]|nr:autotransporter outer membrane beta-barrel domain-containing protein [Synergistaceae bacterium]